MFLNRAPVDLCEHCGGTSREGRALHLNSAWNPGQRVQRKRVPSNPQCWLPSLVRTSCGGNYAALNIVLCSPAQQIITSPTSFIQHL